MPRSHARDPSRSLDPTRSGDLVVEARGLVPHLRQGEVLDVVGEVPEDLGPDALGEGLAREPRAALLRGEGLLRQREQDLVAAAEVLVEGAVTDAGRLHDVGDAGCVVAVLGEEAGGGVEQGAAGLLAPGGAGRGACARSPSVRRVSQNPTRVSK